MVIVKGTVTIFVFCFLCTHVFAQQDSSGDTLSYKHFSPSPAKLYVRNVILNGNKKTKNYIILRELVVKQGDSILISQMNQLIERSRQNIYNTTLFVEVKAEPRIISASDLDIIISIKERWYIFPIPQFQLVDRSFNEWLVKYNGTLKRVNYGVKFVHQNLTGRNDQLRLNFLNGYTRNISASYNVPYSNSKLTEGLAFGAGFSQVKELAYKTDHNNEFVYYKSDKFVRNIWNAYASYTIRKAIKKREILTVGYTFVHVSDSIISPNFNPKYFNDGSANQNLIDFSYNLLYADVNNILYPLSGFSGYLSIQKRGLGLTGGTNMFSVEGVYNKYYDLGKKWYTDVQIAGKIKLPFDQPYINQRALGDRSNYVRGLEYFIIDGVAYGLVRSNLKKEILNFKIPTFLKSKTYNKIPFKIYAKVFTDLGYVYSKEKPSPRLNNTLLCSAGVGLDVLTLYDVQLRIEFSFNQLGQQQLFFHSTPGGY